MKNTILIFVAFIGLSACATLGPGNQYYTGMKERKFLRQNRDAVIASLDGPLKTYRVNRDDRFYILATFENERIHPTNPILMGVELSANVAGWKRR